VLLRVTKTGSVRFAKRFAFPTGDLSLGSTLVPVGQDLVVTGLSFEPTQTLSYVMRFDGQGDLAWSERVDVCGSSRVRIEAATLRASGGLALLGTYDSSPERVFFASLSAAGAAQTAHANWTGSIVEDVTGVALAELPTSGFVTLERYTPSVYTSNALELSTRDSLGARTEGKGYALKDQAGTGLAHLHPAGLRLTTDGGAIVVAHVTGDGASNDDGLWVSKIPARTFQAPFDAHVSPAPDAFPEDPCSLAVSKVVVQVADLELEDVDVTPLVSAKPIVPVASQRTQ
jgi:hypothetical protein